MKLSAPRRSTFGLIAAWIVCWSAMPAWSLAAEFQLLSSKAVARCLVARLQASPPHDEDTIYSVALSADARLLVTAAEQATLWDVEGQKVLNSWESYGPLLRFSRDGRHLLTGGDEFSPLRLVSLDNPDGTVEILNAHVPYAEFLPDGVHFVSITLGRIEERKVSDMSLVNRWTGPAVPLAFSASGKQIAAQQREGDPRVQIFATHDHAAGPLWEFKAEAVVGAAFASQGDRAAVWGTGPDIEVCSHRDSTRLEKLSLRSGRVRQCVFSPDDRLLAVASLDGTVSLWEIASSSPIARWQAHGGNEPDQGGAATVAFSLDGTHLASGGLDHTAAVWNLETLFQSLRPADVDLAQNFDDCWTELSAPRAHEAFAAWAQLESAPDIALPEVERRLGRYLRVEQGQRIQQLLAELDSPDYQVREQATGQLQSLGELAEAALRQALEDSPSVEVRFRIRRILAGTNAATPISDPERWRLLRVIFWLERLGPRGVRLLEQMATSLPSLELMEESKAALERSRRRALQPVPGPT